ncbi:hypothetical protein E2562_020150, partial [Oryza meyeriana var. granulata]
MYPDYTTTADVDRLRLEHYSHLDVPGAARVCLDYCGFGLFDSGWDSSSSSFTLSELNANLSNHALYGGAEPGTAENDIKERILEYLNVPASEYALVFTVSRGSAFRLLAECYPFESNRRLLTMFDHESQSVSWMAQSARAKGAKTRTAWFRWPTLKLCTTELRKEIVGKRRGRRRDAAVGLFVFPAQSRVTGAKYSYQWMALAQQNGWHVMLDAGALGPKDMDSLGLSLFRPDFIITSFYRVFGADPTGFGCLLIKKSVIGSLQGRNGCNASGMVRIVPVFPQYLSDSVDGFDAMDGLEGDSGVHKDEKPSSDARNGSQLPAFSGVYTSAQVREAFESDPGRDSSSDRDGASTIFEETESIFVGEVMRSPAFSEDCSSENSFWVDVGQSPLGSEKGGQFKKGKLGSPLPSSWFAGRKSNKRMSPNLTSRISRSPLYDGQVISFDAAVLSVSHDADCLKEDPEEEIFENGQRNHFRQVSEIQEEPEVEAVACQHAMNGGVDHKESAIRRETEGEFRLLGGRDGNSRFAGGRLFGVEEIDGCLSMGRRVSFSTEANIIADRLHRASDAAEASGYAFRDDDGCVSDGYDDAQDWSRREPEIICRHIDHVDMMGLNRTTLRLRYLINWLVTSLLQLRLPDSKDGDSDHLVHIYGPKIKYERGAAVAFNVKQSNGTFVNAEVVQKIAEKNGISLGIGLPKAIPTKFSNIIRGQISEVVKLEVPNGKTYDVQVAKEQNELTIPKMFAKNVQGHMSRAVKLEVPDGKTYDVEIAKEHNELVFRSGWEVFASAYELEQGDILVFGYRGDSHFKVRVFNPSSCEKELSCVVMNRSISDDNHRQSPRSERMNKSCTTCMDCITNHYWRHMDDRERYFFKVMMSVSDVKDELAIPKKFAANVRWKIPEEVRLEVSDGKIYNVQITEEQDELVLRSGWANFASAYELKHGDLLVFIHSGHSHFKVLIFDPSCTEKEFSCVVTDSTSFVHESSISCDNHLQSPRSEILGKNYSLSSSRKRPKMNLADYPSQRPDVPSSEDIKEPMNLGGLQKSKKSHYVLPMSYNMTSVQKAEVNALEKKIQPHIPLYITAMDKTSVASGSLVFSKDYAVRYLLDQNKTITLCQSGGSKKWDISLDIDTDDLYALSTGWLDFFRFNLLQEGDICVFEASKSKTGVTLTFHPFKESHIPDSSEYTLSTKSPTHRVPKRDYFATNFTNLTDQQKRKVKNKIQSIQSDIPIFLSVMRSSNCTPHGSLCFSVKYASRYLPHEDQIMRLRLPKTKYKCKAAFRVDTRTNLHRLLKGWGKFVNDNKLEVHDICLFQLMKNKKKLTMTIHIIRKGE